MILTQQQIDAIHEAFKMGGTKEVTLKVEDGKIVVLLVKKKKIG